MMNGSQEFDNVYFGVPVTTRLENGVMTWHADGQAFATLADALRAIKSGMKPKAEITGEFGVEPTPKASSKRSK